MPYSITPRQENRGCTVEQREEIALYKVEPLYKLNYTVPILLRVTHAPHEG